MNPCKFSTLKNKYEWLKTDCLDDVEPMTPDESWTVTSSRAELITILIARLSESSWVYGYTVFWAKGGMSSKQPTAELGLFRSARDAKLHAIGFMLLYLDYFLPDTRNSLQAAEKKLNQLNLFE